MRLELKTIQEWYYTNSMGEETRLADIDDNHLINSFAKAIRESSRTISEPDKLTYSCEEILRKELLRRIRNKE